MKPLIEWCSLRTRRQDVRDYRLEGIRIVGKPVRYGCEDDRFVMPSSELAERVSSEVVRKQAIRSLGESGDPRAVEFFREVLTK